MSTILDNLKNKTSPDDQQGLLRGLIQAKSGKQGSIAAGPGQSRIQQKMAEQQLGQQAGQIQQKVGLQNLQQEQRELDINQRGQQQQQTFLESLKDQEAGYNKQNNAILDQFARGEKSLRNDKDIAALHQLGVTARLENQQYVTRLKQAGQRARFDDINEFKLEMAKTVFSDQTQLLDNEMKFRSAMNASDNQFAEDISEIDTNSALEIADNAARAANVQQAFSGGSDLIGIGTNQAVDYATDSGLFKKDK